MFNRKRTPDVKIHIEGFNDGIGLRSSLDISGTGESIAHAFASSLESWCKKMKVEMKKELAVFNTAVMMVGLIDGMGEDVEEAWNLAHELLEAKNNLAKKVLEQLEDKELVDSLMDIINATKED